VIHRCDFISAKSTYQQRGGRRAATKTHELEIDDIWEILKCFERFKRPVAIPTLSTLSGASISEPIAVFETLVCRKTTCYVTNSNTY
jgi:hypothetical protein